MNLINCTVTHKVFGKGTIVEQNDNIISVRFATKEVNFISPDAFCTFLICEDKELQKALESAYTEKKEAEKRKAQEQQEAKQKAESEAKRKLEEAKAKAVVYSRHADENNLAFKCNFCDGGHSADCLGFKGVCTDAQIRYNIEKKKRAWCCDKNDSYCYKYYNHLISREELDQYYNIIGYVCYESKMLIDWTAEAGENRNGVTESRARRIANASRNSLAVLTTELPDMEGGKERVIFGVFITGVVDEGDDIQAGYVKAQGDYYVELTPKEAKKMKFWHYHKNANNPSLTQWGTGLYRYMKDSACARILLDIISVKKDASEKAHVQKMLEYYCQVKNIDINNIPKADGAI